MKTYQDLERLADDESGRMQFKSVQYPATEVRKHTELRQMTQKDRVLNHLQTYGRIDPHEALERYGVMRLGARIWDLRHDGYSISTAPTSGINRYGDAISYATYIYSEDDQIRQFTAAKGGDCE